MYLKMLKNKSQSMEKSKKEKSPRRNVWSPLPRKNMFPLPEQSKTKRPESISEVTCVGSEKFSSEFLRSKKKKKKNKIKRTLSDFLSKSHALFLSTEREISALGFLKRSWACGGKSSCSKAIDSASATERSKTPPSRRREIVNCYPARFLPANLSDRDLGWRNRE